MHTKFLPEADMRAFIFHTLKQLFNAAYISLLFLYSLLGWLLCDILYMNNSNLASSSIIESYNMVIFILVIINSIYFIISHFRKTLNAKIRDVIIMRLSKKKYFWGLAISYFIYITAGYIFPLYVVALFQQVLHGASQILLTDYISNFLTVTYIMGAWIVILPIALIIKLKNDLLTLLIMLPLYMAITYVNILSSLVQTNSGGCQPSHLSIIVNIIINILAVIIGIFIARKLTEYDYNENISSGIFSAIAGVLKFELSKFHYKMLGLKTQNLFLVFGSLGFVFILKMLNGANVNGVVIVKIYVAVFFPLLFSFNQYNLIAVDLESGMIAANFLRKIDYSKIVFNRWLTMLAPQLILAFIFSLLLLKIVAGMDYHFMILVILFNILFSSLNFFLSVSFKKAGYPNFVIGFIAYLMLREDVHTMFASNPVLNCFNIFESVTSFTMCKPQLIHIAISFAASVIFITFAYLKLSKSDAFKSI